MIVEATLGDLIETRTSFQGTDYKTIYWSPGDEINLFYGNMTKSRFTSTMTEPSASASFEGTLGAATGASGQGVTTQTFWGVYPYDPDNICDGTGVTLKVKEVQTTSPNSFGKGMNPSVANSPGLSLSFYNVGSWFVFSVTESGITSVKLSGNNGEDLAGKVYVTMDSSGKPVSQVVEGEGLKSIIVTPEDGNSFIPNTDYCITVIPQTLSSGFTFTMYKGDQMAIRKSNKSLSFERSSHTRRIELDNGLTWQTLYVDMGDGVKWATMNVGADSPEGFGDHFAWGETSPKPGYTWIGYKWGSYSTDLTKYVTKEGQGRDGFIDGKSVLEPEDDAATVNWGGDWRMPTEEEWLWLKDNCQWTPSDGGHIVTSNVNGNTIFLPAAGYKSNMQYFEGSGVYWSATLDGTYSSQARAFFFNENNGNTTNGERYSGYSVRPVKGESHSSKYVELGPGVKWAKMNVGASSPEETGDYFAWGETSSKDSYSWNNYKWGTYSSAGPNITKYNSNSEYGTVDGRTTLLSEDDAATVNWGGDWRTPTLDEWNWLMENCTMESVTQNGVAGYKFTSNVTGYEGNSIFFPAAGYYLSSLNGVGSVMSYWGSNVYDGDNSSVAFQVNQNSSGFDSRCTGRPVRAVYMPRVPLTSFSLSSSTITVGVELKQRLWKEYSPSNATETGSLWTSSNEAVARVDCGGEVTGVSPGTATITAVSLDGEFTASCEVIVIPTYVDMGGGMEWATFNVGAETPTEAGDYFAWGEVSPKNSYTWSTYRLGKENNLHYYNATDGLVTLLPARDVATTQMGGLWHTPSSAEWAWLKDNCTWSWVANYQNSGKSGYVVQSTKTGNSIFLPAAGNMNEDYNGEVNITGNYWTSSLSTDGNYNKAYAIRLKNSGEQEILADLRFAGFSIRAVRRKWVDMGDGLKWATTNVGGFNPEDYGDYFAWGETKGYDSGKTNFSWGTYKWMQEGQSNWQHITKYTYPDGETEGIWYDGDTFVGDGQTRLSLSQSSPDDAARANWGGSWRMPTGEEWTWLLNNCTWKWTTENGVYGRKVTSNTTGNTIFLPAAGDRLGTTLAIADSFGDYWSSSLGTRYSYYALGVHFSWEFVYNTYYDRYYGKSVRPVSE